MSDTYSVNERAAGCTASMSIQANSCDWYRMMLIESEDHEREG